MFGLLLLPAQLLAFYQPPDGKLWLAAWLDTADTNITSPTGNITIEGDRPSKLNSRLGVDLSSFQYAQNFPVNYTAGEFPFPLEQIDATLTDAVVFLTVYPFKDAPVAERWSITDLQIEELAEQIGNMTKREWNPLRVLLRLAPEMNGNWFGYGMVSSARHAGIKRNIQLKPMIYTNTIATRSLYNSMAKDAQDNQEYRFTSVVCLVS